MNDLDFFTPGSDLTLVYAAYVCHLFAECFAKFYNIASCRYLYRLTGIHS